MFDTKFVQNGIYLSQCFFYSFLGGGGLGTLTANAKSRQTILKPVRVYKSV